MVGHQTAPPVEQAAGESDQNEVTRIRRRAMAVAGLVLIGVEAWFLLTPSDSWLLSLLHITITGVAVPVCLSCRNGRWRIPGLAWDTFLTVILVASALVMYLNYKANPYTLNVDASPAYLIAGAAFLLVVLEMTRRATGWVIPVLCVVGLAYAYWGWHIPGRLSAPQLDIQTIVGTSVGAQGVFGIPLRVSATYIFVYVLMGIVLKLIGADTILLRLAVLIAGRGRGGPAKIAVASSAGFGLVSGSSAANVAVMGSMTIPLMAQTGYGRVRAAAIEAVASSGGQILLGAVAFMMADLLGVPFTTVFTAALIPFFLYYFSLYVQTHLEAVAVHMPRASSLVRDGTIDIPSRGVVWDLAALLPLAALFVALFGLHRSPIWAGFLAIIVGLLIYLAQRLCGRQLPGSGGAFLDIPGLTLRSLITIATTTAAAGVVINILAVSGLGVEIGNAFTDLSGGHLLALLFLVLLMSAIIGTGAASIGDYAITAAIAVPALTGSGVLPLAAQFFVMMWAVKGSYTPPVGLAVFTAATLARANLWRVSLRALGVGLGTFLVPFSIVYHPELVTHDGPWIRTAVSVCFAALAVTAASAAAATWSRQVLHPGVRLPVLGVCAVALISTSLVANIIGSVVLLGVLALMLYRNRQERSGPTVSTVLDIAATRPAIASAQPPAHR